LAHLAFSFTCPGAVFVMKVMRFSVRWNSTANSRRTLSIVSMISAVVLVTGEPHNRENFRPIGVGRFLA